MALLTTQQATIAGLNPNYQAAAAGGDSFANDGRTMLHVKNGGGSSINVTLTSQQPDIPAGAAAFDQVVAVPAGAERMIGPINQKGYNDASGEVQVAYSAVTTVTVAVISLRP